MQSLALRTFRTGGAQAKNSFKPTALSQTRFASSGQATSGQAGPNTSSNMRPGNPQSSSPGAGQVNSSRATVSRVASPGTVSTKTPVSGMEQAGTAVSKEPQPSQENMKRDPNEPADSKRAAVEKEGQKPLDLADK